MIAPGRIEQVRGEARVEAQATQLDADPLPGDQVALQIVPVLAHLRVLQQWAEQGDRLPPIHLCGREELSRWTTARTMPERNVDGLVGERDSDSEQLVVQRLVRTGEREKADTSSLPRARDQLLHGSQVGRHGPCSGGRGRSWPRQVLDEPHELQFGEECARLLLV